MVTGCSSQKGKKGKGVCFDDNTGSGWKSPFKLLSPIVHTKSIFLHDWWLMQPEEGQGIGVGGLTIRSGGVETFFSSASIKERRDNSTLDTSDGFTIFISGLINMSFTEKNGFPSEIYNHFINGFPCNWDDFATQHVKEGSTNGGHSFPLGSFQDMSYLQKRDLLLTAPGIYEEDAISEHLFNDLLEKLKPAFATSMDDTTVNLSDICTRSRRYSPKVKNGEFKTKKKAGRGANK